MLTSSTNPAHQMTPEEQNLYCVTLVAHVLAKRLGGEITIPVSDLMDVAGLEAKWDRRNDCITITLGELCQK